jgi:hypothetical protein
MQCQTCKREMNQLFYSQACDYCDYGVPKESLHRGFSVLGKMPVPGTSTSEYVFRTRTDAELWRVASGREGYEICPVYSTTPFRWHLSRGTLRGVVLADSMFEVFADHRYEPLPNRAFFVKEEDPKPLSETE